MVSVTRSVTLPPVPAPSTNAAAQALPAPDAGFLRQVPLAPTIRILVCFFLSLLQY
jgi:hypothetical protein